MCAVVACLLARAAGIACVPMAGEERRRRRGAVSGHRVLLAAFLSSHSRQRLSFFNPGSRAVRKSQLLARGLSPRVSILKRQELGSLTILAQSAVPRAYSWQVMPFIGAAGAQPPKGSRPVAHCGVLFRSARACWVSLPGMPEQAATKSKRSINATEPSSLRPPRAAQRKGSRPVHARVHGLSPPPEMRIPKKSSSVSLPPFRYVGRYMQPACQRHLAITVCAFLCLRECLVAQQPTRAAFLASSLMRA
ncbi:hypothetical protein MRX96_042650 [Rhipicephalus microplus]